MKKQLFDLKENSIKVCDKQIEYYSDKAKRHKRFSLVLSYASIIFTVLGIIAPLIDNIPTKFFEEIKLIYWGYLSLGIAGGFQLYDRVIGNTNSWIRFIKSELELKKMKQLLLNEWEHVSLQIDFDNISKQETESFFKLLLNFNKEVFTLVEEETKSWADTYLKGLNVLNEKIVSMKSKFEEDISAYESELKKEEKEAEAERAKAEKNIGFLRVEIKNPLDFDTVEVELLSSEKKAMDEKQILQNGSQDAIFPELKPSKYILIVTGIVKDKQITKKVFVDIVVGKVALQSITLSKIQFDETSE